MICEERYPWRHDEIAFREVPGGSALGSFWRGLRVGSDFGVCSSVGFGLCGSSLGAGMVLNDGCHALLSPFLLGIPPGLILLSKTFVNPGFEVAARSQVICT